jgi:hypothetical protein
MPILMPLFLAVQGAVFLVWAVLAFRFLFALRADAVAQSGRTLPSMATQLKAFRGGLIEQRYRRLRVRLMVLTALLIALSTLSFVFIN